MKVALEPIKVPLTIPNGTFAPLLVGKQRLSAQGTIALAQGDWELSGESPLGIRVEEGTEGTLECDLVLRGESSPGGEVELWPEIKKLSIQLNQAIAYSDNDKTVSLEALDLESQEGGEVGQSVGVRLADTIALALTKLTSEAAASRTVADSALDLIAGLNLESLELSIVDAVNLDLSGQKLQVDQGTIRVTNASASFAEQRASAMVEIQLHLGAGTALAHEDVQLNLRDAALAVVLAVEHRDQAWLIAPSADHEPGALRVEEGELKVRDAVIQLAKTELSLGGLSLTESSLAVAFEGTLRLDQGSVAVGPTQLTFAAGFIDDFLVNLEGQSESQPTIDFRELGFEQVTVAVASSERGQLTLNATNLRMESRTAVDTPLTLQLESAQLEVIPEDGRRLEAQASQLTLNIDAPQAVGLGALAPADGSTLTARFDRIRLGEGEEAMILGGTGVELMVKQTDPLNVDITLHTASTELISKANAAQRAQRAEIGDITIKAGVSADGALSLGLLLPFATVDDMLRMALPERLEFELSAKSLSDNAVKTLGLQKRRGFSLLRDHVTAKIALEGQQDIQLSAQDGGLNLNGTLTATIVLTVELGRYATLLQTVAASASNERQEQVDLARKRMPFDVDWTLELSTNAPVSPTEFALLARPIFSNPPADDWLAHRVKEFFEEQARQHPLSIPLGSQFGHQLAALEGVHVDTADIKFTEAGIEIQVKALRPAASS